MKIYYFELKSFLYSITLKLDKKQIFEINKKKQSYNEDKILIKNEKEITNELHKIENFFKKKNKKNV